MAETELKAISSGSADVIVEVEEEAPLSNDKDDEENAGSDGDSSSNTNDNQAPQDSHRRKYTVDEITNAIKTGNLEAMRDWLSSLPQGDERKDELNKVKYKHKWGRESRYCTVLHIAAKNNQVAIAKELLQEGADPNITDSSSSNALHRACLASHDVNITKMVELLIERVCNIDETTDSQCTPLHYATRGNHTTAVKMLLQKGADPNKKNEDGWNALHWVCYASSDVNITEVVELLIERGCNIDETNDSQRTPLHYAARDNHTTAVKMLLQKGADPNKKDVGGCNALHLVCKASSDVNITEVVELLIESNCRVNEQDADLSTPLHKAALWNNLEAVRILVKNGADVELQDRDGNQPIHNAALQGNNINEMIDVLVKELVEKHDKIDPIVLEIALRYGYKYIVKQLIKIPKWATLMRHTFKISGKITTPFREMVKKMPDVAEEILNKCTMNDPGYPNPDDEDYSVAFCYEFLEDARDKEQSSEEGSEDRQCEFDYYSIIREDEQNYSTSWGPEGFEKQNHPLAIMVQYKRLNLLNHPVVTSLLHHKWNKFGLLWYIINLLTYLVFLVSLTTFALIIENPKSQACLSVSVNMSSNYSENYCGISTSRVSFIYISALVVIIVSLCRLVLEGLQFKIQLTRYLYDWNNWMETALYICSIISVCVFGNDCLCPLTWQWQIGVVAVFLGWMNLVVFISKFPSLGIYVLMFINIFKTFLKTLLLSILLIVSFGLTFYLTFTQPEILRSPFSTPGRSLLKIVTMTTGELDFDSIFRQDPAGGSDDAEEVPFPPISYMLWIAFIIIMPILLNNMLVGLAIDDIGAVQKGAELQKLALQVEHVLTVEEFLPRTLRRKYTCGYKNVYPNRKWSLSEWWRRRNRYTRRRYHFRELKKKFIEKCQLFFWGGRRYDTLESIKKVLTAKEDESMNEQKKYENLQEKTDELLLAVNNLKDKEQEMSEKLQKKTEEVFHAVDDLKTSVNGEVENIQQKNDEVLHEVEDLKTSVNGEVEKIQQKNDEVLHEVEDLKAFVNHQVEDLKTSVDSMKMLLKEIAMKLSPEAK